MTATPRVYDVNAKIITPSINLSPYPILDDIGNIKLAGLDNHTMGIIFEE